MSGKSDLPMTKLDDIASTTVDAEVMGREGDITQLDELLEGCKVVN